jgi:hypothetical protein
MWTRSFVATTVALGGTVDEAVAAIESPLPGASILAPDACAAVDELVAGLRAPQRSTRAAALANAVRDIAIAIDDGALL